jgi:SAM-dependent methyltransferase
MTAGGYLLDNQAPEAGGRFDALADLFDPVTTRHVDGLGIGPGARCWLVGAGGPSLARHLAGRVGPDGAVLATDIDITWLEGAGPLPAGVEVRRHDVAADAPPADDFDLVHARLVLVHVPEREEALRRMVQAVRPGGWVLVEDFDMAMQPAAVPDPVTEDDERANAIRVGFRLLLGERGADAWWGRTLARRMRSLGLVDVVADAYLPLAVPAARRLERANVEQVRAGLVARGHATDEDIDAHLAAVDAGTVDIATPPLVSARGRRP